MMTNAKLKPYNILITKVGIRNIATNEGDPTYAYFDKVGNETKEVMLSALTKIVKKITAVDDGNIECCRTGYIVAFPMGVNKKKVEGYAHQIKNIAAKQNVVEEELTMKTEVLEVEK